MFLCESFCQLSVWFVGPSVFLHVCLSVCLSVTDLCLPAPTTMRGGGGGHSSSDYLSSDFSKKMSDTPYLSLIVITIIIIAHQYERN